MIFTPARIRQMGARALLLELGDEIDESLNAKVHTLARTLEQLPGVVEVIPAYASLLIESTPEHVNIQGLRESIERIVDTIVSTPPSSSHVIEIPTRYGGEFGPDLGFVALHNGVSTDDVIRLHTSRPYRVFMLGFAPGFAYLGSLPQGIAAPRLESPRVYVPAGSVGIAGRQTGIYPRASPGGWRLIGRTDVQVFDPSRNPPTLLQPGDYVHFKAITE